MNILFFIMWKVVEISEKINIVTPLIKTNIYVLFFQKCKNLLHFMKVELIQKSNSFSDQGLL